MGYIPFILRLARIDALDIDNRNRRNPCGHAEQHPGLIYRGTSYCKTSEGIWEADGITFNFNEKTITFDEHELSWRTPETFNNLSALRDENIIKEVMNGNTFEKLKTTRMNRRKSQNMTRWIIPYHFNTTLKPWQLIENGWIKDTETEGMRVFCRNKQTNQVLFNSWVNFTIKLDYALKNKYEPTVECFNKAVPSIFGWGYHYTERRNSIHFHEFSTGTHPDSGVEELFWNVKAGSFQYNRVIAFAKECEENHVKTSFAAKWDKKHGLHLRPLTKWHFDQIYNNPKSIFKALEHVRYCRECRNILHENDSVFDHGFTNQLLILVEQYLEQGAMMIFNWEKIRDHFWQEIRVEYPEMHASGITYKEFTEGDKKDIPLLAKNLVKAKHKSVCIHRCTWTKPTINDYLDFLEKTLLMGRSCTCASCKASDFAWEVNREIARILNNIKQLKCIDCGKPIHNQRLALEAHVLEEKTGLATGVFCCSCFSKHNVK